MKEYEVQADPRSDKAPTDYPQTYRVIHLQSSWHHRGLTKERAAELCQEMNERAAQRRRYTTAKPGMADAAKERLADVLDDWNAGLSFAEIGRRHGVIAKSIREQIWRATGKPCDEAGRAILPARKTLKP